MRFLFILIAFAFLPNANAASILKVAVLDNLQGEKFASEQYERDYLDGLDVAREFAKSKGLTLEIKTFFYGKEPLAVLGEASKVKEWKPDIVLGPRSSNAFLPLKDVFSDVLVLSPLATATAVSNLPDNFYSLTPPNPFAVQALSNYVKKNHPRTTIFRIVESDCKNCADFATQFVALLKGSSNAVLEGSVFLSSEVETLDIPNLLKGYQPGNLILMANTSYTSGVLMNRISTHLGTDKLIFLGGDGWGSWKSSFVGKLKSPYQYKGIRIAPWSLDLPSSDLKMFRALCRKRLQREPNDTISFISFRTLVSAIKAMELHRAAGPVREQLLNSYKKQKQSNPSWDWPKEYAVYTVTQAGESYTTSTAIKLPKGKNP